MYDHSKFHEQFYYVDGIYYPYRKQRLKIIWAHVVGLIISPLAPKGE